MTIHYERLKARVFPDVRQTYQSSDCQLYALSLGLGNNPLDEKALPFLYEGVPGGLRVLPTVATVLGYPGFWTRDPSSGIDWKQLVHGEQRLVLHRTLPSNGTLVGKNRITQVIDKGEGKGAIVVVERLLENEAGDRYATLCQVLFCRGDGGYSALRGGQPSDTPLASLPPTPEDRAPDFVDEQSTRPEAALIYRLLGDNNPLHADPAVARAAGFERPILHGLASYGIAAHAVIRQCAGLDPARLRSIEARFASPVYPGETLRTEIWQQGVHIQFRVRVVERDRIVLSHGRAEIA
jgi:acyl dehydratase